MKKLIAFVAAFVLAASAAQAASFSRAISAPSRPASVGMSRPSVTNTVRSPAPAQAASSAPSAAAAPQPHSYAPASQPAPTYHAPAPSTGSTFMSSLGGSLAGTMLGNAISGNHGSSGTTIVNNGAASAPASSGQIAAAPAGVVAYQTSAPSSSTWSWFWSTLGFLFWIALVLGALLGGYMLFRHLKTRHEQQKRDEAAANAELPFAPVARFLSVQKAFATGDAEQLRGLLGPDLIDQSLASLPAEPKPFAIVGVAYDVVDMGSRLLSIHYRAHDTQDGEDINEVWHFVNSGGRWLLNGIEQV